MTGRRRGRGREFRSRDGVCSVMAVCGRFEMRAGDSCCEVELVVRVRHGLERQHYWR